jgi:hypothetical protein
MESREMATFRIMQINPNEKTWELLARLKKAGTFGKEAEDILLRLAEERLNQLFPIGAKP